MKFNVNDVVELTRRDAQVGIRGVVREVHGNYARVQTLGSFDQHWYSNRQVTLVERAPDAPAATPPTPRETPMPETPTNFKIGDVVDIAERGHSQYGKRGIIRDIRAIEGGIVDVDVAEVQILGHPRTYEIRPSQLIVATTELGADSFRETLTYWLAKHISAIVDHADNTALRRIMWIVGGTDDDNLWDDTTAWLRAHRRHVGPTAPWTELDTILAAHRPAVDVHAEILSALLERFTEYDGSYGTDDASIDYRSAAKILTGQGWTPTAPTVDPTA